MNVRLLSLPALGLILASCETGGPINSGFDPLNAAGGAGAQTNVVSTDYQTGEFVIASMSNTGFFKRRPEGDAVADKLLDANTPMKVIKDEGSFIKVELDSGEVGYVNTVQVIHEGQAAAYPGGSEVQVYPPLEGTGTIPLDPVEPGMDDAPMVPTDIDPDAPVEEVELPDALPEDGVVEPELPPLPDAEEEMEEVEDAVEPEPDLDALAAPGE